MGMLRTLRRGVTWTALALAGGAAVITVRHLLESPQPLHSALPGTGRIDREHGGEMYYNVAGPQDAPPIVLLHDFSPGASNFEYRGVFGLLASTNRVYAPDWLGYGMSEHPNIAYTGEFYAGVLVGFLRDIAGAPATVVGLGRAANVVVRAASDAPQHFSRVVLVSPDIAAGSRDEPTLAQTLVRASQRAFLGIVPYAVVSTRPVLRYLTLRSSARHGAEAPADEAVDQRYSSAHQFGGQHAALAMLTGELDLPVRNAFALLEPPALVVIGAADQARPAAAVAEWTGVNPRADLDVIPDAGYDVPGDQPRAFVAALDRWLETLPPAPAPSGANLAESNERDENAIPGLPGYVVPGVSDMGLQGSAAVTIGGITTMEPEIELGPEPSPTEEQLQAELNAQGLAGTPAAMLPEAGDADPASIYEEMARQGTNPPLEPEGNIASVAAAAEELKAARSTGEPGAHAEQQIERGQERGQMEGLTQIVETPPAAPAERTPRATHPLNAEPAAPAGPSTAEASSEQANIEEQPTAPQRRVRSDEAQSSTRVAPRKPSAHVQATRASSAGGAPRRAQPATDATGSGRTSRGTAGASRTQSGGKSAKSTNARSSKETKKTKATGPNKRTSAR